MNIWGGHPTSRTTADVGGSRQLDLQPPAIKQRAGGFSPSNPPAHENSDGGIAEKSGTQRQLFKNETQKLDPDRHSNDVGSGNGSSGRDRFNHFFFFHFIRRRLVQQAFSRDDAGKSFRRQ
jgi:hypothetical protein